MTLVALEDAYGLHIVGGNALITVEKAATAMRNVAAELGCPISDLPNHSSQRPSRHLALPRACPVAVDRRPSSKASKNPR